MKRGPLAAAVFVLASSGFAEPPPAKLAVLVAVDGLSWARLEGYRPWYQAGFKRLLDEGFIEGECRYRHLNTETGPGHSALSTGAPPRVTGIVANSWFEVSQKGGLSHRYCVDQKGPTGVIPGPASLRVPTLGDRLLDKNSASRVVSVSGKDRASILMAGHAPAEIVYWFDQVTGHFVTSAAYSPSAEAQSIVDRVNRKGAGPGRFGLFWKALPVVGTAAGLPQPIRQLWDYQTPVNGLGFPHPLNFDPRGYFPSLFVSPYIDEVIADLAVALVDGLSLGRRETPDFLAISFSAQDTVSHQYGSESEENLDVLRRLDIQFGRLLEALDRVGPKGSVILALSSDHGFADIPEARHARETSFKGGRISESTRTYPNFTERLDRLVADELCLDEKSHPIFGVEGWNVAYRRPISQLHTISGSCGEAGRPISPRELDGALKKVVGRFFHEEIEEVLVVSERAQWNPEDPAVEFAQNDYDAERSGDAFLVPRYGVVKHGDPARGSGHGTHHEYDIHVPLVFWGGEFPSGRSSARTTPYDLAPTLGEEIGIPLPDGRALHP